MSLYESSTSLFHKQLSIESNQIAYNVYSAIVDCDCKIAIIYFSIRLFASLLWARTNSHKLLLRTDASRGQERLMHQIPESEIIKQAFAETEESKHIDDQHTV